MKVINYNQAAKLAGVSRQCIQNMKKLNQDKKKSYPFFCFDPGTGKHGINIDDIAWKKYVDKDNSKRVNKKAPVKNTESKSNYAEKDNDASIDRLLESVEKTVIKIFKPSPKKKNEFFTELINNLPTKGK